MNTIRYKTINLPYDIKRQILLKAKEVCYDWRVDILDCSKSIYRKPIKMSFEEIMSKFDNKSYFTVIHRNKFGENFIEFCFSTNNINEESYFLWIFVNPDKRDLFKDIEVSEEEYFTKRTF